MVESIPSQINFSQLLSHTFPGIFTTISIIMIIDIIFYHENINRIFQIGIIFENWIIFIGALGGLVFFGTITGVIIDSIHHVIVDEFIDVLKPKEKITRNKKKIVFFIHDIIIWIINEEKNIIDEIKTDEDEFFGDLKSENGFSVYYFIGFLPLERFQFLIDNHYSYVEFGFNLSISFLFSSIIYPIFIIKCGYELHTALLIGLIMFSLSLLGFRSAVKLYINYRKIQLNLIKGAIKHQNDVIKYCKW